MLNLEHSPGCNLHLLKLEQYLPPDSGHVKYRAKCPTCDSRQEISLQEVIQTWPELKLWPDDNGEQDFPD